MKRNLNSWFVFFFFLFSVNALAVSLFSGSLSPLISGVLQVQHMYTLVDVDACVDFFFKKCYSRLIACMKRRIYFTSFKYSDCLPLFKY